MRILHTSDWHVGKLLRGASRADEHRAVLVEIAELARREEIDLILVGGDLFETAAPGPEAEEIVYRALLDLAETAEVAVIAGNHDNARRLRAVSPLLGLGRVRLVSAPTRPEDGGVIDVTTEHGEVARLAMLPFVSQRGIVRADDLVAGGTDERSPKYAERVARVVEALCGSFGGDTVNLVLAHLMVAGGVLGGGERSAHTVFDYSVPAQVFPVAAQYVALGHLHRAQELPAACPVRYCGSPLQLDFGETGDTKSVTIVIAEAGRPADWWDVELEAGRRLRTIEGSLEELRELADTTGDDWLRVRVHEQASAGLGDQVREWFPHAVDVRVVTPDAAGAGDERPRRSGLSPVELFDAYLAERDVDDDRVRALFAELLDEASDRTESA